MSIPDGFTCPRPGITFWRRGTKSFKLYITKYIKPQKFEAYVSFTRLNQKTVVLFLGYGVNIRYVDLMHLNSDPGTAKRILKWGQNSMIVFVLKKAATMVGSKKNLDYI